MEAKPMVLDRNRCEILTLVLKKKWFDMIASGEKYAEYRTSKSVCRQIERWYGRACMMRDYEKDGSPFNCSMVVKFCLGYGKNRKSMLVHAMDVKIRGYSACPDWGEPNEPHTVIVLGGPVEFVS